MLEWMLVVDCMMSLIIFTKWEVIKVVQIFIKQYDEKNNIVYITKEGKDIWGTMSMMQFEDDMDYFGIPVRLGEKNGKKGYVFSNNFDNELIYAETKRFIEAHKLEKIKCL